MKKRTLGIIMVLSLALVFMTGCDSPNNSIKTTPTPSPKPTPTKTSTPTPNGFYEAEWANLSGGAIVENDHTGYKGTGFVAGFTEANKGTASTRFNVSVLPVGNYITALRYANGSGSTMTLSLYVNDIKINQISLPATANWNTWTTQAETVSLNAGGNAITYKFDTTDSGNVNLDSISVTYVGPAATPAPVFTPTPTVTPTTTISPANTPTVTPVATLTATLTATLKATPATTPAPTPSGEIKYDAEKAFFSGNVKVNTVYSGYSGTGYLDNFLSIGAKVIFAANVSTAGDYSVAIRYANGNSTAKTLSIYVNGIYALQTSLAATGGWGVWGAKAETLVLRSGVNTITYQYGSVDSGNVNIDSMSVAGGIANSARGATLPYVEYQAENAATNAMITPYDIAYHNIPSEASGRQAVKLLNTGDYVQFTLANPANSLVIRYCIPDAAAGGGITASISLYINGTHNRDVILSSKYSWVYGSYPWSNNPSQGSPHRFFEETRLITGELASGTTIRLQKDSGDTAAYYYIDLIDAEEVAPAYTMPSNFLSVTNYGAVANDGYNDAAAVYNCISAAQSQGKGVWIPAGTFNLTSGKINVPNGVIIRGAGQWYTVLSGKYAGFLMNGNNQFYDFSMYGDETTRNDSGGTTGMEGNATNSVIQNIWFEHLKCGMWINAQTNGAYVEGCRIRNLYADGVNINNGTQNSMWENNDFRYTGDDSMAMWSTGSVNVSNTFRFNTVQLPWLANCIAVYGGRNNTVSDNMCYDSIAFGGGVYISTDFGPVGFIGTLTVAGNTLIRCSGYEWNLNYARGAIWVRSVNNWSGVTVNVSDMEVDNSTYQGISIEGPGSISGLNFTGININQTGTYGIDVRSNATGSATFNSVAVSNAASGGLIKSAGANFSITGGSGNSGW